MKLQRRPNGCEIAQETRQRRTIEDKVNVSERVKPGLEQGGNMIPRDEGVFWLFGIKIVFHE